MFGAAWGVAGGMFFVHLAMRHHPEAMMHLFHGPVPRRWEAGRGGFGPPIERLERELDLTGPQRDRIEAEVERTRLEGRALRESLRVRIERQLTTEQRARFRALAPPSDEPGPEHGPWPRPDRAGPAPEREEHR
ncbi:MAG: hypothetical protein ACHQ52_13615, partial [Candidatus Eisenbacteria bacterium]